MMSSDLFFWQNKLDCDNCITLETNVHGTLTLSTQDRGVCCEACFGNNLDDIEHVRRLISAMQAWVEHVDGEVEKTPE